MKKARMIFITIIVLILGGTLIYNMVRYIRGDVPYSTTAEIQNFSVCDIKNSVPGSIENITVCGHLLTDGIAGINIYVYGMPGEHLVGHNPFDDEFRDGDFSRTINLENSETYAHYKVVVYLYRNIIAITEFETKH